MAARRGVCDERAGLGLAGTLPLAGRTVLRQGELVGWLFATLQRFHIAHQRLSCQPLQAAVVALRDVAEAILQGLVNLDVKWEVAHDGLRMSGDGAPGCLTRQRPCRDVSMPRYLFRVLQPGVPGHTDLGMVRSPGMPGFDRLKSRQRIIFFAGNPG